MTLFDRTLFDSSGLGGLSLPDRVVMAPMTQATWYSGGDDGYLTYPSYAHAA